MIINNTYGNDLVFDQGFLHVKRLQVWLLAVPDGSFALPHDPCHKGL